MSGRFAELVAVLRYNKVSHTYLIERVIIFNNDLAFTMPYRQINTFQPAGKNTW